MVDMNVSSSRTESDLRMSANATAFRKANPVASLSLSGKEVIPTLGSASLPPPPDTAHSSLVNEAWSCGCPDCGAPLTVRAWLGLADCWNCSTSISLDHLPDLKPVASNASLIPPVQAAAGSVKPQPIPPPRAPVAAPKARTAVASSYDVGGLLSPWLISLIVHLIVLTLLGLIQPF